MSREGEADKIYAARLDRLYISRSACCRVSDVCIHPSSFSDHHSVTMDVSLVLTKGKSFNVKLLTRH